MKLGRITFRLQAPLEPPSENPVPLFPDLPDEEEEEDEDDFIDEDEDEDEEDSVEKEEGN